MIINTLTLNSSGYPAKLKDIPGPPKQLFVAGVPLNELLERPAVAIVGSRQVTPYGEQVTSRLARELAEQGITIVSGLAYGVDSIAHQAALDAGGLTIAVLPGPLEEIHPVVHEQLAEQIINSGGALVSEYPEGAGIFKQNFIARNRLVSGLAQAVLVTEATEDSGCRHTVRFAEEQKKTVLSVPGNITSPISAGTNKFIKKGATLVTSSADVLKVLKLRAHRKAAHKIKGDNAQEQAILDLLLKGVHAGDELLALSRLAVSEFNQVLTMLEITGKIRSLGPNLWALT